MIRSVLRLPIFNPEAIEAETSSDDRSGDGKGSFSYPSELRKLRASIGNAEAHGARQFCGLKLPISLKL
jgi:hypothetical protein